MVDFSKLQKISSLARELMKHGQASSMDEAMRQASQQVESGNVPEFVETPNNVPPVSSSEPTPVIETPVTVEMPRHEEGQDHSEVFRKFEEILSRQQTTLAKISTIANVHTNQLTEVASMTSKFNSLVAEITQLKEEVRKLKESPVMPSPGRAGQTSFKPSSSNPSPSSSAPAEKKPDGTGHARSGNYNPGDVSIEKMFYMGGK